jgi:hypothetical protein
MMAVIARSVVIHIQTPGRNDDFVDLLFKKIILKITQGKSSLPYSPLLNKKNKHNKNFNFRIYRTSFDGGELVKYANMGGADCCVGARGSPLH